MTKCEKLILKNFYKLLPKIKDYLKRHIKKRSIKTRYVEIPICCGMTYDLVEYCTFEDKFIAINYIDDETQDFMTLNIEHLNIKLEGE